MVLELCIVGILCVCQWVIIAMRGKFTLPFSVVCKKGPALKHMLRH